MRRTLVALVVMAVLGYPTSAGAGRPYSQAIHSSWQDKRLDILILPPSHGQVVNENGVLGGEGAGELTPFNSYLRAVEDSITGWNRTVDRYGVRWIRKLNLKSYVVGRDEVPSDVLQDPEAVIMTNEHQGTAIGLTLSSSLRPECVITNAKFFVQSFTYEDMYSVNSHEVGHCLGLEHLEGPPQDPIPSMDLMWPFYPHQPGTANVDLQCISNMNLRAVELAFAPAFGRVTEKNVVKMGPSQYRKFPCE
ncbi:MAG: hypothetical protein M3280_12355 [Actinomycetota bacterium]|nr:hypothetical protein [Actinomycetota bacterium]